MKVNKKQYVTYLVLGIYPCQTGGMEIFYFKLLPKIAEKEYVALITHCNKIISDNYKIIRIPKNVFSIPKTSRIGTLFYVTLALVKHRKQIKIVHFPYTSNAGKWGFVLPLLKIIFGIKYLLHIHGGGMKPWQKRNADRILFKHADKLLSVSSVTKEEYQIRSNREIEVVLPLVQFEQAKESKLNIRRKFNYSLDVKIILSVGSLKELKAPDVLLEAFTQLGKEFIQEHKLRLIFVGDGPLRNQLAARTEELGLAPYVVFTGKISYDDVPEYYKMSDIYVIPSKFEGTPKSLLEAMYNILPVIGSNVNGISNLVKHNENGFLFQPNNSLDLKEKIIYVINNPEKAKHYAEKAHYYFSKHYNINTTITQLINFYNQI